ncbi:hypothetical protein GCM10011511_54150 [Puia dinghuensis]|uniref:Uncharacterized protein n=2 Tax=Puia dinghuensis TaxID=1792502 RepID=A0A8J2UIZ1_9BACT|nr:hypothetical protein GCM10011511_54150 [Puia dinghuensis]
MQLFQPILARSPEGGHPQKDVLPLSQFLALLREEEDYWPGEQTQLPKMITRLRKIFYDKWGWNKELICRAAPIECRYQVTITGTPPNDETGQSRIRRTRHYKKNNEVEKYRLVTYRADDRVYGNTRVGQVPFIYQHDHQEVLLPDGTYCDIAHVLAGLDAWNNPQLVSPLPQWLSFLHALVPHCDSNMDLVTWLGDIATSAEDFVFAYLRNNKHPLSEHTEQHYVYVNAPGSDMLGDIDSYAIAKSYDLSGASGKRLTDILEDYYTGPGRPYYAQRRYTLFSEAVGLQWDGRKFANEEAWIKKYYPQLRDATTFMIFSLTEEDVKSIALPFEVWCGAYKDVAKCELLLRLFLKALQALI